MDRERLKEVHQSDLTEGRINEDFVDWLKTKGTSWLLVIVIALFGYAAWVRWQNYKTSYQSEAWAELSQAALPSSYEDVAEKYSDVGAVAHLARLRAAGQLLNAVQAGQTLGAESEAKAPLDEHTRADYLEKADRIYAKVIEADDDSPRFAVIVSNALTGRAAVAESKGEVERAKQYFTQAAQRCEALSPLRAKQLREHADTVDSRSAEVSLPTREQLLAMEQKQAIPTMPDQLWSEPWVNDLLQPQQQ